MGAVLNNNWPISYVAAIEYSCFFWLKAFGLGGDGVGAIGQGVGQEESQDLLQLCSRTDTFLAPSRVRCLSEAGNTGR